MLSKLTNQIKMQHSFENAALVRAWGLEPQHISAREPKSRMSTNSIMPAYLIFQITHRAGNEKTFSVVTAPKSRMSTNSITGAYLLFGDAGTRVERKNLL